MSDRVTVCLIGPTGGGKTSLLATLTECVTQRVHGYSSEWRPALEPITQEEFDGSNGAGERLNILGVGSGPYEDLRSQFVEGVSATPLYDTYEYFFKLELNGVHDGFPDERLPIFIQVIDAAGEIPIPVGVGTTASDTSDIKIQVRTKFSDQILKAEALVFIVPLVNLEDTDWIKEMSKVIEKIAGHPEKKLQRAIVAFTQYERLFVRLGPSAFTYACDPRVALHVIRNSLQATPWLDGLRRLEKPGSGGVQVRFTVTSAYGFSKRFRNPNIDPHENGGNDRRFRRADIPLGRALNECWRPFLTAEPILYAALKQDSAFTFSYEDIDGIPRSTRPSVEARQAAEPKAAPRANTNGNGTGSSKRNSFWTTIRDALDVNRR
jgi:hypothetical protein